MITYSVNRVAGSACLDQEQATLVMHVSRSSTVPRGSGGSARSPAKGSLQRAATRHLDTPFFMTSTTTVSPAPLATTDVPVFLVSDIDRGGIFASLIGTLELLTKEERSRVKGIIINKFRGDPSLFQDGVKWIEDKTGIPVLGVLPYIHNHMIEREDSTDIPISRLNQAQQNIGLSEKEKVAAEGLLQSRYDALALEMRDHLDWEKIKVIISEWESK